MTTDQHSERTGLRLPWSSDRRSTPKEEPTSSDGGHDDAAGWARRGAESSTETEPTEKPVVDGVGAVDADGGWDSAPDGTRPDEDGGIVGGWAGDREVDVGVTDSASEMDGVVHDVEWPAEDVARAATASIGSGGETDADDSLPGDAAWSRHDPGADPAPDEAADASAGDDTPNASAHASGDASAPDGSLEGDPASEIDKSTPEEPGVDATSSAAIVAAQLAQAGTRPTKFLAELSRAMQAAAQTARDESVEKVGAAAKARIEEIQQRGTARAADLRRESDEDVAATREWSKAEIARIREETDQRITERKARLEQDLETHGERVRQRVDLVRQSVTDHEQELAAFIERLLAEDDPTAIATLAQQMPDAPALDQLDIPDDADGDSDRPEPTPTSAANAADRDDLELEPDRRAADGPDDVDGQDVAALVHGGDGPDRSDDPDVEDVVAGSDGQDDAAADRLTAEFAAAAEAEALAGIDEGDSSDWLAGAARRGDGDAATSGGQRTELLVTGLSSVAGIAGFKRELSRLDGVSSVAVSAGQAGDFVFAVTHAPDVDLAGSVPSISAFSAAVHDQQEGTLLVSAAEPEAD